MNDVVQRGAETAADAIARRLAAAGVRHAFGIPGGEVLALIDALDRAGIAFVTARHESAAGLMAEGTWHAGGAPAVLVATVGPGLSNAVHAIAAASQDRVPLLVISGAIDPEDRLSYTHQVFDHQAVARPLVKATFSVPAGHGGEVIDRAIEIATRAPCGPVHVDLPISVAGARELAALGRPSHRDSVPSADPATLAALAGAERPLVIAGLHALDDGDAVLALAEAIDAPVITTYKAKGVLDERSPRALGGAGLSPRADAILLPLVRRADVVVLAGYDPIEMRKGWRRPFAESAAVIEVAPEPPSHGVHRATLTLVGEVREALRALARRARASGTARWPGGEPARARAALREAFAPEASGWGPLAIAHAARASVPEGTIVTVDTGAHRIAWSQAWEARAPRTLLQSSGLCTMGCALPLAIGASLAQDRAPVVAVTGDGGLDMVLGELATARDTGARVVVVVIDDRSLGLIEMKQRAEGLRAVGVALGETDYAAVARAIGIAGERVDDAGALAAAIARGLGRLGPSVIHCPIPPRAYDGAI